MAVGGNHGEGERHRRMGDIGPADVEQPGDRMGIGDDEGVGLELPDLGAHAVELVGGRFPGELQVVWHHRAVGRRRAVAPDGVDRVGLGRDQDGAGGGAGLSQALGAFGAVQPGVVAELLARREVRLDPGAGRLSTRCSMANNAPSTWSRAWVV